MDGKLSRLAEEIAHELGDQLLAFRVWGQEAANADAALFRVEGPLHYVDNRLFVPADCAPSRTG